MRATRTFAHELGVAVLLVAAGVWLWIRHAAAWGLGSTADILGYDAAQYAVAARELARHGRLATLFALPVDLVEHALPPWPLSLVQPGLLLVEALLFRLSGTWSPDSLSRLVLALPFACFLATAIGLALAARRLLERRAPATGAVERSAAACVVGLAFLLDPEAQHYAAGGFTELPFTLGLAAAVTIVALGVPISPWRFGALLAVTGLFRGNMLWLAPLLAAAYAWSLVPPSTPSGPNGTHRAGGFIRAMAVYAVVLAPWWIYKAITFGNPAWDLSALSVWDGIGGRTWFSLNHLPEMPDVPRGTAAVQALLAKVGRNVPALLLDLATGPRTLWVAALILAVMGFGRSRATAPAPTRPEPIAAVAVLAMLAVSLVVAAATVPQMRYMAPVRLVAEAAGVLATWAFLWRLPPEWSTPRLRRLLGIGIACLALGWGVLQTIRGTHEASALAAERGVPPSGLLRDIARELDGTLERGEAVMSNLGPTLAWHANRPVVHLALTPADVDACRHRVPFDTVVLAFRDAGRAWPGWGDVVARPDDAPHRPEWNIVSVRHRTTPDGFTVVWLELGPLHAPLASAAGLRRPPALHAHGRGRRTSGESTQRPVHWERGIGTLAGNSR